MGCVSAMWWVKQGRGSFQQSKPSQFENTFGNFRILDCPSVQALPKLENCFWSLLIPPRLPHAYTLLNSLAANKAHPYPVRPNKTTSLQRPLSINNAIVRREKNYSSARMNLHLLLGTTVSKAAVWRLLGGRHLGLLLLNVPVLQAGG